ncbi:STAS domain-containing protein [Nocardia sp. NPDC051981]|uniref:STAS domain-containing protein n=1 Tax=Nocardia sp. NPDC051981 TaxID=3155417 RepID=UPI00342DB0F1
MPKSIAARRPSWLGTHLGITHTTPAPSMTVLTATGEIDHNTIATLRDHLSYAIGTSNWLVVLDLSRVTIFSISGLRAVLDADNQARQRHRILCLVTGSQCVDRLLELSDHPTCLATAATVSAACTANPAYSCGAATTQISSHR